MKNEFRIEFQRAYKSRGLIISLFVGLSIATLHFILMVLPLRDSIYSGVYPLSVFGKWIGGEDGSVFPTLYYFVVPILVALPNAGSYKEDIRTGYIKNVITRTPRSSYLVAKYIVTFLVGGCVGITNGFEFFTNSNDIASCYPAVMYRVLSDF